MLTRCASYFLASGNLERDKANQYLGYVSMDIRVPNLVWLSPHLFNFGTAILVLPVLVLLPMLTSSGLQLARQLHLTDYGR